MNCTVISASKTSFVLQSKIRSSASRRVCPRQLVCLASQKPNSRLPAVAVDAPAAVTALPDEPAKFTGDFLKPTSIPQEGIDAAVEVMQSGRVFRYSATSAETSQVSQAEKEFAEVIGCEYALGLNSCASGILLMLMVLGVKPGDKVLSNGFTFTALPSSILRINAVPVLVECKDNWTIDLEDLERKMDENPDAKVLLLSHMRGKVVDMDALKAMCDARGVRLCEDCAHAIGINWNGKQLGSVHGELAAWSSQSDKVINSGEGGFVTTNNPEMFANMMYMAGCYENRYGKHLIKPDEELCKAAMKTNPALSIRMHEVTAAMIRPQLAILNDRVEAYGKRYESVTAILDEVPELITVPKQLPQVRDCRDHLNFSLVDATDAQALAFQAKAAELGVPCNRFGSETNCRWHRNWEFSPKAELPKTDEILISSFDLKLPLEFTEEELTHLAEVLVYSAAYAKAEA